MDRLSSTFAALADPTRRAILARLSRGEASVGDLARPFDISLPAVSRHLNVLERAGLIEREVDAQWRLCRLKGRPLREAHGWLERYRVFWEERLDSLVKYLEEAENRASRRRRT
jgi:DNA-binding transcriptional ArsR family regulator